MSLIDKFCQAVDKLHLMDLDIQAQSQHWGTAVSNQGTWQMMQSIHRAHLFNEALPVHVQLHFTYWIEHYKLGELVSIAFSESECEWFLDNLLETFVLADEKYPVGQTSPSL